MSTGYRDKNKKFHPINNKTRKVRYSGTTRKVGVPITLGKPKPPAGKIKKEINEDLKFRNELTIKNEALFEKIEEGTGENESGFTKERREQFKKNREVIRDLEKDIKNNIKRLDKEDRKTLPTNVKNDVRTFR